MIDRLSEILKSRVPEIVSGKDLKPAAVLVPIQEREEGSHLILTRRGHGVNSHRGEIAFPGGKVDSTDLGPLDAALRESEEEIGLHPGDVRVLGRLDPVTAASIYLVTPFVGLIPFPYQFRLNQAETEAVFSIPISSLMEPDCFQVERRAGSDRPIYHFYCQNLDIWGATARIIKQLLELGLGR